MTRTSRDILPLYGIFLLLLTMNIGFWLHSRHLQPLWGNVPPAMSQDAAIAMALGDRQMAYRTTGLMLQNFGNTGGFARALKEYDYQRLGQWLSLGDSLDPDSEFLPILASFYFGASQDPSLLDPIVDYLAMVGMRPEKQKWRWLAQAVYIARFVQGDLEKAKHLAETLASLPRDDLPIWAKKMPVFVETAMGNQEAAYTVIVETLRSSVDDLDPIEINFLVYYLCQRVLTADQAKADPLCKGIPL